MTINCPQCSARLTIEDGKLPARQFTVRCPKCQHIIDAQPPAAAREPASPITVGDVAFTSQARYQKPAAAPVFKLEPPPEPDAAGPGVPAAEELARALVALLQGSTATIGGSARPTNLRRRADDVRRVLVCADPQRRFAIARVLVEGGHEVFVAEDTAQAIERMREDHMHVVILEPSFDAEEKGAAFIRRELSALRPAFRRRTFYIHLTAEQRTGDPHAAFINHANFVLNAADIEDLSDLLGRAIREFNELYQDFNCAIQAAGI